MRWQPTRIELLEVKHPGLEKDVCDWLKSHLTGAEVSARLRAKYHETVPRKTINNYRKQRLGRELEEIRKQKIRYLGFMEAVGEKGLDAGAAAKLWEALQRMTPTELIALRRLQVERARVKVLDKRADVDVQRAKNEKKKLEATLAQLKKQGRQAKGSRRDGDSEAPRDALELRRRVREIYGLPDDSAQYEDKPLTRKQAFLDTVDAIYGLHGQCAEPKESESAERPSGVRSPMSDESRSQAPSAMEADPMSGESESEVRSPTTKATSDFGLRTFLSPASDARSGGGAAPAGPGDGRVLKNDL